MIFCLLLSLFLCVGASAQSTKITKRYLDNYDSQDVHFGFFFAPSSTRFNIKFNRDFLSKNTAYLINSPEDFSLKMGALTNFNLNDYFDFRVLPTITLYNRQIVFNVDNAEVKPYRSETTWFEMPVMLKYKSERRDNFRMYMFGGARVGFEGSSKRKLSGERLNVKKSDFSLEYGIGAERFFEFFKFSPELHFSHGLTNMYIPITNVPYGAGIDKFTSHSVTLYLLFE